MRKLRNNYNTIFDFFERWYYVFLIIIILISCINLFHNLGKMPINSWDEARHGVSAYEMIKNKNYIVNTYSYKNDYWNLKPPVSFWAIVLGYKILGYNALGLRFFSAAASLITIGVVTVFTFNRYGKAASLSSAVVLSTTVPFITEHCARTGDADAVFILFYTIAIITLILAKDNIRWLYVAGFAFSMAFLSKSWHAGSIVIIFLIYIFFDKQFFKLFKKKAVSVLLFTLLPAAAWACFRFREDGFLFFKNMVCYDLL